MGRSLAKTAALGVRPRRRIVESTAALIKRNLRILQSSADALKLLEQREEC